MQETISFGIVGLVVAKYVWTFYRRHGALLLAQWFLKRGHVKTAMKLRRQELAAGQCSGCK